MYEEEKSWFLELKEKYDDQAYLTQRFQEEFERYAGQAAGARAEGLAEPRSFEGQQLFGIPLPGQRPEPRAAAASQDQRLQDSSPETVSRMVCGVYP